MPPLRLVRAFVALWWTTGAVILVLSAVTAKQALHADAHDPHVALLAAFEAVSALLFLLPWTLRAGAAGLLLTLAAALLIHGTQGHFRGDLLVYAAVVVFVAVHGPVRPT